MDLVPPLDAAARAALDSGKPLLCISPPAPWTLATVFAGIPGRAPSGLQTLVISPTLGDAADTGRMLRQLPGFEPVHVSTGSSRTSRLLAAGAVRTLLATPPDAVRLLQQSALPLGEVGTIALLWAEMLLATGHGEHIDTLLAEAKQAQRIVMLSDEAGAREFTERHARRAPVAVLGRPYAEPSIAARYVVVDGERRVAAARATLDTLDPATTLLWDPAPDRIERWQDFSEDPTVTIAGDVPEDRRFDLALAVDLPTAELLSRLAQRAGQVVVLIRPEQLPYLQRLARPLRGLRLPGPVDRERERAAALQREVRERIESGSAAGELLALAPLFDEFDPALVAAALARPTAPEAEKPAYNAWVRIQVSMGKRDRVRPADLLGALLNGVGLPKDHVGRIEIKESSSTIEVRMEAVARAIEGMAQLSVRGRPLAGRVL